MNKRNLVQELMQEKVWYGGCICTRKEVYEDARKRIGFRGADITAFGTHVKKVTDQEELEYAESEQNKQLKEIILA